MGASGGFNYKSNSEKGWDEQLIEQEPQGVDFVLDPVGGNYFAQNLKILKTDASLVLYGLLGKATKQIDNQLCFFMWESLCGPFQLKQNESLSLSVNL